MSASPSASPSAEAESSSAARKRWEAGMNVGVDQVILDETRMDKEVALLVSQYLASRSYGHIAKIIEEQILERTGSQYEAEAHDVEQAIHNGDFSSLEALLARPGLLKPQSQKAFLYLCYRQQFLEHVENRESQKAFNLLSKRLKPLEHYQPIPYDFYSLSYLTSASTVHDAPSFRNWAGVDPERDVLVRKWRELIDADRSRAEVGLKEDERQAMRPGRLVELFRQAGLWQVMNMNKHMDETGRRRGRENGKGPWRIASDYRPMSLPNALSHSAHMHSGGAKCVTVLSSDASTVATGGSDGIVNILGAFDGSVRHTLRGHTSRIWDVAASAPGDMLASASGDGTVRLWSSAGEHFSTLGGEGGDVYGVRFRPSQSTPSPGPSRNQAPASWPDANGHSPTGGSSSSSQQITTASYDRIVRSYDIETSSLIRTFSGHSLAALCVAYDPVGTLIASGAKDRQVRLWDVVGGVCVNTMSGCLGEVTSVEFDVHGRYLLVGSKDNANRLWDLRMVRIAPLTSDQVGGERWKVEGQSCYQARYKNRADMQQRNLYRYTGHQNTAKNFIRCSFALDSSMIIGGSEDGNVYAWEREPTASICPSLSLAAAPASTVPAASSVLPPNGSSDNNSAYPARPRQASAPAQHAGAGSGINAGAGAAGAAINVRPYAVLEAEEAHGAVFDVKESAGLLVCAWNDGHVGFWQDEDLAEE